ncbi:MAG: HesA/MoeB/ThiF family protein [Duncaniella sp.]|nr:HesA/MoeB/ThiF family protein [Duncaniella sp.]
MELTKDEKTRYRGHISLCEIDLPGQQRLRDSRVLIVGAGGLGSPVGLYLAAAGVGTIGIVDADAVSLSNLQRQIMHGTPDIGRLKAESARDAMLRINPAVNVELHTLFIDSDNAAGIMRNYDVVVDCTDNISTRLLINDECLRLGLPFVFGAVRRFGGQIFTHRPGTADYRSIFGNEAAGDDFPCAVDGVLNTVVGITGSIQATEVIKLIVGTGDLLTDRLLTFDSITMTFNIFDI